MKLLFVNTYIHPKNLNSIMAYKKIEIDTINSIEHFLKTDLLKYDYVYSPSYPIDISKCPNTNFIFGPHFSVFPDNKLLLISGKNSIYIQPSKWTVELWQSFPLCNNLNLVDIPFGIDTNKFNEIIPISNRNKVFIYYKRRNPAELYLIESFLRNQNIEYRIFDYIQKYDESEYLNYLQQSNFGIWLDAHESQGFALEEALSCNVPLLVWNVESMNQEYGSQYNDIPATTIPYWDNRCGEYFYKDVDFISTFQLFLSKLDSYQPRQYVLENLSMEICEQRFINILQNMIAKN
jgi:hypothetical protein